MISVGGVADNVTFAAVGTGVLTTPFDFDSISVSKRDPKREPVETGVLLSCSTASPVVSLRVSPSSEGLKKMMEGSTADEEVSFVADTMNVSLTCVQEGTLVDEMLPAEAEAEEVALMMVKTGKLVTCSKKSPSELIRISVPTIDPETVLVEIGVRVT